MFKVQIEHQSISLEEDLLCCESFKIYGVWGFRIKHSIQLISVSSCLPMLMVFKTTLVFHNY